MKGIWRKLGGGQDKRAKNLAKKNDEKNPKSHVNQILPNRNTIMR